MVALVRRRLLPIVRGDRSLLPCIHIDDAASATVAALDRAPSGASYDIVDDRAVSMTDIVLMLAEQAGAPRPITVPAWLPRLVAPYVTQITSIRLPLSNARAKAELGWSPSYPTWRDGLASISQAA